MHNDESAEHHFQLSAIEFIEDGPLERTDETRGGT